MHIVVKVSTYICIYTCIHANVIMQMSYNMLPLAFIELHIVGDPSNEATTQDNVEGSHDQLVHGTLLV